MPSALFRSRKAAASVAALIVVVALVVFALLARRDPAPPRAADQAAPPATATGPAAAPSPPHALSSATTTSAASRAAGAVTLCGHGPLQPDERTATGLPAALDAQVTQGIDALTATLARGDERQQATAAFLQMSQRYLASMRSPASQAAPADAVERARTASAADRAALARLAQTTRDPEVYRLAYLACVYDPAAHCTQLSAAQWARLDPTDALPWLYALTQARTDNDPAAQAEAVHRLSLATRMSNAAVPLALLAEHPQVTRLPMPVQVGATLSLIEARLVLPLVSPTPLVEFCVVTHGATRDPVRVQQCGAAARVLVNHADDRISRQIGLRLGAHAGWPADEVQRLRDQLDAEYWIAMQRPPMSIDLDCASFERLREQELRWARDGELASLRREVADSGVPVAELARRFREAAQSRRSKAAEAGASSTTSEAAAPPAQLPSPR